MSTVIIIGGGGGHNAITRLVAAYPHMSADEQATALQIIEVLVASTNDLLGDP